MEVKWFVLKVELLLRLRKEILAPGLPLTLLPSSIFSVFTLRGAVAALSSSLVDVR